MTPRLRQSIGLKYSVTFKTFVTFRLRKLLREVRSDYQTMTLSCSSNKRIESSSLMISTP